jgi:hypothetical protein
MVCQAVFLRIPETYGKPYRSQDDRFSPARAYQWRRRDLIAADLAHPLMRHTGILGSKLQTRFRIAKPVELGSHPVHDRKK